jgi:hypothetical protein
VRKEARKLCTRESFFYKMSIRDPAKTKLKEAQEKGFSQASVFVEYSRDIICVLFLNGYLFT